MERAYIISRKLANGATAFLVMEERDETVSVFAKFPYRAANDIVHEHRHIAAVPEYLVQEIEERPTWNFPTSTHLKNFIEKLWEDVEKRDSWYIFA